MDRLVTYAYRSLVMASDYYAEAIKNKKNGELKLFDENMEKAKKEEDHLKELSYIADIAEYNFDNINAYNEYRAVNKICSVMHDLAVIYRIKAKESLI